jgi:hypothetical protein
MLYLPWLLGKWNNFEKKKINPICVCLFRGSKSASAFATVPGTFVNDNSTHYEDSIKAFLAFMIYCFFFNTAFALAPWTKQQLCCF